MVKSHAHKFTPSGTIENHKHTFTPSGTVSITTNPTFTGSEVTTGEMSGDTTSSWLMAGNKNGAGNSGRISNKEIESDAGSGWKDHNIIQYTIDLSHTHSVTAEGSISGGSYSFSGNTNNTSYTQPSFTGSAGTTSSNDTTGIENRPTNYTIRIWKRTA